MSGLALQFFLKILMWSIGPILIGCVLGARLERNPLQLEQVRNGSLAFIVGIASAMLAAFVVLVFLRHGPPWSRSITVGCLVGGYVAFCVARVRAQE